MRRISVAVVLGIMLVGLPATGVAAVLSIPGSANIFGAGHASPPDPAGGGGGTLPPVFALPYSGGGGAIQFSAITGTVFCCNGGIPAVGPDGANIFGGVGFPDTNINSYGGIAGIQFTERQMFLVGVFLDGSEPIDPAPARLTYGATGDTFLTYYPGLSQVFFIGDGLSGTGSGSTQSFFVPAGATRLFLGFADGFGFIGFPGGYGDNSGSLSSEFDYQVPEPGTLMLLGLGLAGLSAIRRREN